MTIEHRGGATMTDYAGGTMDDRTAETIRHWLHPDAVARFGAAIRVPESEGDRRLVPGTIQTQTLPIRQMQAPAPFTGPNYLLYRWYVVVDPDEPDVALVAGESFLQDCGPKWMVDMTAPLR